MKFLYALALGFFLVGAAMAAEKPLKLENVEFNAKVNVHALDIHGESKSGAHATADFANGLPTKLDLTVPVKSLETGNDTRDEHMQNRVFKTEDGKFPDIRFVSKKIDCKDGSCDVDGELTLRGVAKPATAKLKVAGGKLSGESKVKLSDWSIEAPSQLGIKVKDEVEIKISALAP